MSDDAVSQMLYTEKRRAILVAVNFITVLIHLGDPSFESFSFSWLLYKNKCIAIKKALFLQLNYLFLIKVISYY